MQACIQYLILKVLREVEHEAPIYWETRCLHSRRKSCQATCSACSLREQSEHDLFGPWKYPLRAQDVSRVLVTVLSPVKIKDFEL